MTVRYVDGTSGNDAYDGLAAVYDGVHGPKKTLNGAEDTPVAAGDLVHVRAGVYRELLTVDVSGTAGNAIEYRGDYAGAIWPGGGVVRITGSNDDQTAARNGCVVGTSKAYRTWTGLAFDSSSGTTSPLTSATSTPNWTVDRCYFQAALGFALCVFTAPTNLTVRRCVFFGHVSSNNSLTIVSNPATDNTANMVENCLFVGRGGSCIAVQRVGGVTVRNCTFIGGAAGVRVETALNVGQTTTVNNCVIYQCGVGLQATAVGEITEDYNVLNSNGTARSNVTAGANSVAYPPLFDARWFFQLVTAASANQVITPFDLASYSQLINLAGTSPTTTDMRGTSAIGGVREIGALEYDSGLKIQGGGGGAVSISPLRGRLGG